MRSSDSSGTKPFLRESARLYVLYMCVGITAIPAGIAYGICVVKGYDRWWVALGLMAVSLYLARQTWKYIDSRLRPRSVFGMIMIAGMSDLEMSNPHAPAGLYLDSLVAESYQGGGAAGHVPDTAGMIQIPDEEAYACAHN
jgi:hypothetical protein